MDFIFVKDVNGLEHSKWFNTRWGPEWKWWRSWFCFWHINFVQWTCKKRL